MAAADKEKNGGKKPGTPDILNEFISKILVHERDVKRAKYAVHRIEVYFNHILREETRREQPTRKQDLDR